MKIKKMHISLFFVFIVLLVISIFRLPAEPADYTMDKNKDGKPDQWYYRQDGIIRRVETDGDYDGRIDNLALYDVKGNKEKEEYDFNHDGKMDDFYFFEGGILIRREIDSNYDNKIDMWVVLTKGVYVKKIERDKDFNGTIDYVKEY